MHSSIQVNNKYGLLPIPVLPFEGESLRGFIFRVSEANGYPTPTWLHGLEPALKKAFDVDNVVPALTRLVGLPQKEQQLLKDPWDGDKLSNQYLSAAPRICPDCLRETGYLKAIWEVAYTCICPQHGTWLVDKCPKCESELSWKRHTMQHCDCGASLSSIPGIKADEKILFLNNQIWKAAGQEVPEVEAGEIRQGLLNDPTLEQLCSLFRFFSTCSLGKKSLRTVKPRTVQEAAGALMAAHGYLEGWPNEFHAFLGKTCLNKEGLSKSFGNLYRHLFFTGNNLNLVQEAFQDYVNSSWRGLVRSKQLTLSLDQEKSQYISTNDAAKILGVGRRFLNNLVDKGLIEAEQINRPSGRVLTVISALDAERLREEKLNWINGTETRRLLGVSKAQLSHCIDGKFIRPIAQPETSGFSQWIFDIRDINRWLHGFQAISPSKEAPKNSISFSIVCKNHLPSLQNIPDLLRAVLEGELSVVGINTKAEFSLSSLHFDLAAIQSLRNRLLNENSRQQYTIPEFAVRLGVKQEVAYHLVNQGIVAYTVAEKKKFAGRMVSEESVEVFESTYLKLSDIAGTNGKARRGAHLPLLQEKLIKSGIHPAIGPGVDGCRQCFYLKAELDAINAALTRRPSNQRFQESVEPKGKGYTKTGA